MKHLLNSANAEAAAGGFVFNLRGDERSESIDIDVFDDVGGHWLFGGITAKDIRRTLQTNRTAKSINVSINSRGGEVFDGLSIYEQLVNHPARVQVRISALAGSIASVIAMAGDDIEIAQPGFVMIHGVSGFAKGKPDFIQSIVDMMRKAEAAVLDIYVQRTGQKREDIKAWMDAETYMTSAEAKERGFVSRIVPAKGKQTQVTNRAFALLNCAGLEKMPADLRAAIEQGRATGLGLFDGSDSELPFHPQLSTAAARPHQPPAPPAPTPTEETPMQFVALLAALGLTASADEATALGELKKIKAKAAAGDELIALTGAKDGDPEVAKGTIRAWKDSHEKLPGVQAKLDEQTAAGEQRDIDKAIADAKAANKLSPGEETTLREQVQAKEMSTKAAIAMLAAKAPIAALAAAAENRGNPGAGAAPPTNASGGLVWNGKAYEDLSNNERATLHAEDSALFDKMRADWKKRGEPEPKQSAA